MRRSEDHRHADSNARDRDDRSPRALERRRGETRVRDHRVADSELVASWDDGVTFDRFPAGAVIQSAAVGETGTIYVIRLDGTFDVIRTDGTVVHRTVDAADAALAVRGRWLWLAHRVVGDNTQLLSDDDGATWHHLEWTPPHTDLVDLVILDGGTVVGRSQLNDCDHFGCGGRELKQTFETTLARGTWRPATRAHVRLLPGDSVVDRHGMKITRDLDSHYIVRVDGTTFRALYTIRP
jgi:hypothetical protein